MCRKDLIVKSHSIHFAPSGPKETMGSHPPNFFPFLSHPGSLPRKKGLTNNKRKNPPHTKVVEDYTHVRTCARVRARVRLCHSIHFASNGSKETKGSCPPNFFPFLSHPTFLPRKKGLTNSKKKNPPHTKVVDCAYMHTCVAFIPGLHPSFIQCAYTYNQ